MRAVFPVLCAALFMATTARAEVGGLPSAPVEAKPVAQEALRTFSMLVTEGNAQRMGFSSPEEVRSAELGVPAMEFVVPLDRLRRYKADQQDPRALLTGGSKVVYPVLVKGAPRSLIELVKEGKEWQVASFGDACLGQQLSRIREAAAAASPSRDLSKFSIIRVPALSLYFLGQQAGGPQQGHELILTPIMDDARFDFKAGESRPAGKVFPILQQRALETPDYPG
jgi:hypothetical protein